MMGERKKHWPEAAESEYPRGFRGGRLSNRRIWERLRDFKRDSVTGYVPTAHGPVAVKLPRKLVMKMVSEAGPRQPAICRFYQHEGEGYICPVDAKLTGKLKRPREERANEYR